MSEYLKNKEYKEKILKKLITDLLEMLFRTYTKKGTIETVNGDQETGARFCYRCIVWGPEKDPGE